MQSARAVASFKIPQKGHRFEEAVVDSKSYLPLVEWTRSLPYCTEAGLFALFSLSRWFVVPSDSRDARPSIAAPQRAIHALLCLAHRSLSLPFPFFSSRFSSQPSFLRGVGPWIGSLASFHDFRSLTSIVNRSILFNPRVDSHSLGLQSPFPHALLQRSLWMEMPFEKLRILRFRTSSNKRTNFSMLCK